MKTIIAGSRLPDYRKFPGVWADARAAIESAAQVCGWEITEVVSGTCHGIDKLGEEWAGKNGVHVEPFPAMWKVHGKSAGPIRNGEMARYADALILVWDGRSRGSASMKRLAQQEGLRIHESIITIPEEQ